MKNNLFSNKVAFGLHKTTLMVANNGEEKEKEMIYIL